MRALKNYYRTHGYGARIDGLPGKRHPLYSSWSNMIQRCRQKKSINWKHYGGKGIIVCDRWRNFSNFLLDMGESWKLGLTLDRINSSKDYTPENCRWATPKEQARNYCTRNVWYEFNGLRMVSKDWAIRLGGEGKLISARLKRGWELGKALTTPPRKSR
jgi:hypothetical protein